MDLGDELLQLDSNKDLRKINKWQQEENEKAGLFGNIGGLLGGVGGYLWLAPLLAGLGPLGLALAVGAGAGLGSWGGGKLGAAMNPDIDTKFAQSTHAQAEDNIKDQIKAKAINNAKNAAMMSYATGLVAPAGAPPTTGGVQSQIPNMTGTAPATIGPASGTVAPTLPGAADLGMTPSMGSMPANDLVTSVSPDLIDANLPGVSAPNPFAQHAQGAKDFLSAPYSKQGWVDSPMTTGASALGQMGLLYWLMNRGN